MTPKETAPDCSRCPRRPTCRTLCQKAEEYAGQDEDKKQWEDVRFMPEIDNLTPPPRGTTPDNLSVTELILQSYFLDRMSIQEIAVQHYRSRQYVYRLIARYKRRIIAALKAG